MYGNLQDGIVFPITNNGKKVFYITDAAFIDVDEAFICSDGSLSSFKSELEKCGYKIEIYRPALSLNFDEI